MPRLKIPKARIVEASANIWKRVVAFLADLLIINIVVIYPFKKHFRSLIPSTKYGEAINYVLANPSIANTMTTVAIMVSIIVVLYFSLSEFKTGTTLGKYFLKLKVKSLGKEVRFWQFFVSNLTFIPFLPFILLWVVDPLHMLVSEKKQRLMERIAKLETVEEVVIK